MYIEADVHGNELQGSEVCLYTIWFLMENYDRNPEIKQLVDERVFYIVPTINPDGRDFFMDEAGSGGRTGHVPVDSDGDGLFDEDGPDDLNGNGVIEQIRKYVPGEGTHRISRDDPRIMEAVPFGEKGDWILLGSEGLDNDDDGRVNEDPPGATTATGTTVPTGNPSTSRAGPWTTPSSSRSHEPPKTGSRPTPTSLGSRPTITPQG